MATAIGGIFSIPYTETGCLVVLFSYKTLWVWFIGNCSEIHTVMQYTILHLEECTFFSMYYIIYIISNQTRAMSCDGFPPKGTLYRGYRISGVVQAVELVCMRCHVVD